MKRLNKAAQMSANGGLENPIVWIIKSIQRIQAARAARN